MRRMKTLSGKKHLTWEARVKIAFWSTTARTLTNMHGYRSLVVPAVISLLVGVVVGFVWSAVQ